MLMVYSRERAQKNRQLKLEEIISFINKIEHNVSEAALHNTVSMPKGGNLLDTLQSGSHMLNTFQQIDRHTVLGTFTSSYNSFHKNKQQRDNNYYQEDVLIICIKIITEQGNFRRGYSSSPKLQTRAQQGAYRFSFPA